MYNQQDLSLLRTDYMRLTIQITSAYVSHNYVSARDVPNLLIDIHSALSNLGVPSAADVSSQPDIQQTGAAEIRQTVLEDVLISFIDGRTYRTLKRHLAAHGLTPAQYRTRYGLPIDYPMTAPSYAAQRSEIARRIGLGVPGGRAMRHAAE